MSGALSWLLDRVAAVRTRAAEVDRELAERALRDFESWHGLEAARPRAVPADVGVLRARLRPDRLPLVVHHAAISTPGSGDDLARVARLVVRLGRNADVVVVAWDAAVGRVALGEAVVRAAEAAERAGIDGPMLVADAPRTLASELALDLAALPFTLVFDADGGVLGRWSGAIDDGVLDVIEGRVRAVRRRKGP